MKRYQECSKPVRILRSMWYGMVPFMATRLYMTTLFTYKQCWRISLGIVQGTYMHYYYTNEEFQEKIKDKYGL